MENILWAIILLVSLFVLVPFNRIKELWPAAVIGFFLSYFINYGLVALGYIRFTKYITLWGGVPPFHVIGVAAAGLLAVNWLKRSLLNKIVVVLLASTLLLAAKSIFIRVGALQMLDGYNYFWAFIKNIAGVALHVWLSIIVIGEEKIYGRNQNTTRFLKNNQTD